MCECMHVWCMCVCVYVCICMCMCMLLCVYVYMCVCAGGILLHLMIIVGMSVTHTLGMDVSTTTLVIHQVRTDQHVVAS